MNPRVVLCALMPTAMSLLAGGCGGSASPQALPQQPVAPAVPHGAVQSAAAPWRSEWRTRQLEAELRRTTGGKSAAAAAPAHGELRVTATARDDSTLLLRWEYGQLGDYDLNGETNLSDLAVLGAYFGLSSTHMLWPEARRADGDGNGALTIADVGPIAAAYGETATEFQLWADGPRAAPDAAPEQDGWHLVATVPLAAGSASVEAAARVYELALADWVEGATYRVTARGSGQDGVSSEVEALGLRGDWWMEQRDAQHTSFAQVRGPSTGHVAWQLALPGAGLNQATPVFDRAGNIYIGGTLGLTCVRPSGEIAWVSFSGSPIVATPAIGLGGTIYCGTQDGRLLAVSAAGQGLWSYSAGSAPQPAAIGAGGVVHFGCADGSIHAVNPDGSGRWVYHQVEPLLGSPALDHGGRPIYLLRDYDDYLVVEADGSSAELLLDGYQGGLGPAVLTQGTGLTFDNADVEVLLYRAGYEGLELWAFHEQFDEYASHFGDSGTYVQSSPALGPQGRIVWFSGDGLRAADSFFSSTVINPLPSGSTPGVDSAGWIYSTTGDHVLAFNETGTEEWRTPLDHEGGPLALDAGAAYTTAISYGQSGMLFALGGAFDGQAPTVPQNVAAMAASDHSVRLAWTPVNGAATYEVFRDGGAAPYAVVPQGPPNDQYKEQLPLQTMKWVDEAALPGVPYEYTVRAVNRGGVSGFSSPVTGVSYLEQPEGVTASDGSFADRVEVTWTKVANATGYRILRDGPSHVFEVGDVAVFNDSDVTDWDEHEYTVLAINDWTTSVGSSNTSDEGSLQRGAGAPAAGDWRMSDHDAQGTRRSGVLAPSATPALLWEHELDDERFGHPDLASPLFGSDNSVCLQTEGTYFEYSHFIVLNADGTPRFSLPQYRGTLLGPDAAIYGLGWYPSELRIHESNGALRQANPLLWPNTPLLDAGGALYAGLTDDVSHAFLTSLTYAGALNWHFDLEGWYPAEQGPVAGPDGTVYIGTRLHPLSNPGSPGGPPDEMWRDLFAINPDGSEKWMYAQHGEIRDYVVAPDGTLYMLSVGYYANPAYVRALAPDKTELWSTPLAAVFQHAPGPLCLAPDGKLVLFDEWAVLALRPDGTEAWRYPLAWTLVPPRPGDLLLDSAGNACFTVEQEDESYLACVSPSGALRWSLPVDTHNFYGLGLRDDGALVVCMEDRSDPENKRTRVAAYQ